MNPGLIRIVIAGLTAVGLATFYGPNLPLLALVGCLLCIPYGYLIIKDASQVFRHPLAQLFVDLALISIVVGATGGGSSPLLPLYLLGAISFGAAVWIGIPVPLLALGVAATATAVLLTTMTVKGVLRVDAVIDSPHLPAIAATITLVATWIVGNAIRDLHLRTTAAENQIETLTSHLRSATKVATRTAHWMLAKSPYAIIDDTLDLARELCNAPYAHARLIHQPSHTPVAERLPSKFDRRWITHLQRLEALAEHDLQLQREPLAEDGPGELLIVPVVTDDKRHLATLTVGGSYFSDEDLHALLHLAQSTCEALLATVDAPAGRDALTNLPNHASLRSILRRELSEEAPKQMAHARITGVQALELTYGRPTTEALLKDVGNAASRGFGAAFCIAEGEFVVLRPLQCDTTPYTTAKHLKERLEESVAQCLEMPDEETYFRHTGQHHLPPDLLEILVGYASSSSATTADQLLDDCDRALAHSHWSGHGITSADALVASSTAEDLIRGLQKANPGRVSHMRTVAELSRRIGQQLGLSEQDLQHLQDGAMLHDIGELSLPAALSAGEQEELTDYHRQWSNNVPLLGVALADKLGDVSETALSVIAMHREHCDGTGYPGNLERHEISLEARITHVADVLDHDLRRSCTIPSHHCHSFSELARTVGPSQLQESFHQLRAANSTFDPQVLDALSHVIDTEQNSTFD